MSVLARSCFQLQVWENPTPTCHLPACKPVGLDRHHTVRRDGAVSRLIPARGEGVKRTEMR
jgi:hypothetical protein